MRLWKLPAEGPTLVPMGPHRQGTGGGLEMGVQGIGVLHRRLESVIVPGANWEGRAGQSL